MPLNRAFLNVGDVARLKSHIVTSLGRGPGGAYKFLSNGGRTIYRTPEQLVELHDNHEYRVICKAADAHGSAHGSMSSFDLCALPASQQVETIRRERYMKGILSYVAEPGRRPLSHRGVRPVLEKVFNSLVSEAEAAGQDPPPKPMTSSTALRWFKRYRESGNSLVSLVSDYRGNTKSRLLPDVRDVVNDVINDRYLTMERINIRKAHRILVGEMLALNLQRKREKQEPLQTPSYDALRSAIRALDQFDVLSKRYGYAYAVKLIRAHGQTPPTERHLARIQIDHTLLDVVVECSENVRFRAWLTLAVDVHSRAVVGYLLSPNPPSAMSILECMRHALLPKAPALLTGDLAADYPMYGIPQEIQVDNGKEFHSAALKTACAQLGITLTYCPPRQPYYKAQVERQFGTINTALLVGMQGRVMKQEPQQYGKPVPVMAFADFQQVVLTWITKVLHHTPGRDGESPHSRWINSVRQYGNPQLFDPEQVRMALARIETRTIQPGGIKLHNIYYNSPTLSSLKRSIGQIAKDNPMVMLKWDTEDLGMIWVHDPKQKLFFPVPAAESASYQGRTYFKHRIIWAEIRARKKAGLTAVSYIEAERIIDAFIQKSLPKKASNKTARKIVQALADKPAAVPPDNLDLPDVDESTIPTFLELSSDPPASGPTVSKPPATPNVIDMLGALSTQAFTVDEFDIPTFERFNLS